MEVIQLDQFSSALLQMETPACLSKLLDQHKIAIIS